MARCGPHTRALLRARDGDLCCWCHEPMRFVRSMRRFVPDDAATIEHLIPKAKGGSKKGLDNMALAHHRCNQARGTNGRPPLPTLELRHDSLLPSPPDNRRAQRVRAVVFDMSLRARIVSALSDPAGLLIVALIFALAIAV